jgi:mycothiol synthase
MNIRPGTTRDLDPVADLDPAGWGLFSAALHEGNAVVLELDGRITGYAAASPLPGLPGHDDFHLFMAPPWRRQRWGSRLLDALVARLPPAGVKLISCGVDDRDEPAALFLQRHGFFWEHTEWEMHRELTGELPEVIWPAGYVLRTYPRREAIAHFRAVYDEAFRGLPSYQPYTSVAEVAEALDNDADLCFVVAGDRPVGFAWARKVNAELGEIEPIGVAQAHQKRGLGAGLLSAGLHYLAGRGCKRVRLGVWADNQQAIRLYQRFGFRHVDSRYFLARTIE